MQPQMPDGEWAEWRAYVLEEVRRIGEEVKKVTEVATSMRISQERMETRFTIMERRWAWIMGVFGSVLVAVILAEIFR